MNGLYFDRMRPLLSPLGRRWHSRTPPNSGTRSYPGNGLVSAPFAEAPITKAAPSLAASQPAG